MIVEYFLEYGVLLFRTSFYITVTSILILICLWVYLKLRINAKFNQFETVARSESKKKKKRIAFFHPFWFHFISIFK
jgi:hypothetical protein